MKWTFPFPLNIRQKVILGLILLFIVMLSIQVFSFNSLMRIESKQHFVVIADDLSNMILEIRRFEKNYLLYNSMADLSENRKYIQMSLNILDRIYPETKHLNTKPLLDRLKKDLFQYAEVMETISSLNPADSADDSGQNEKKLRKLGKNLLYLSDKLVWIERNQILMIIKNLKTQLFYALGVFIAANVFLVIMVPFKIIKPLRIIERTTLRIAQGDFKPIPVTDHRDETQRVVQAFNRMVSELEKRQDQLVQAKKLSSLGTLTSGIAHQLNNPLNNITTSSQILREELGPLLKDSPPSDQEFLMKMFGNIEQEVNRAKEIVKGLLEFSREREFSLAMTLLSRVVESSVKLISSHVPPGIQIIRHVPQDLLLNMDSQRMQQVFLNLFENAIHAMRDMIGEIRVIAQAFPEKHHAVITVEDTGKGIPEGELPHIFDPFFTTKEVGEGTGLGLSIVYGIIQKHFGSIAVESKEGEGTRFTIRLPMQTSS